MALIWQDGFELSTAAAINARYNSVGDGGLYDIGSSSGRTGQYAILTLGGLQRLFASTSGIVVGFAMKPNVSGYVDMPLLQLYDNAGGLQLTLHSTGAGVLELWRGNISTGTRLGLTSAIAKGFWIYVELKVVIDNSAGTYELRVNEVPQFSGTGADTQATANANVAQVVIGSRADSGGTPQAWNLDDYYIANLAAPMPAGDFYGNYRVYMLKPSGAGSSTVWTPSAGANYECVDETAQNGDTDYVASANVGDIDTYACENLSGSPSLIRAVQLTYVARKDDALARSVAPVVRSGGSDYVGGTDALTNTYAHYFETYDQDPATSAAWLYGAVNDLEIGAKVIA